MKKLIYALPIMLLSLNSVAGDGFSGAYAGLQFGYVEGTDKDVESWYPPTLNDWGAKTKPSGGLLGIAAGFNKVLNNNILLGVEADLEHRIANGKSSYQYFPTGEMYPAEYPIETELESAFSLRPRLGYILNGNKTLLFVTAGYASANIKRTYGCYDFGCLGPSLTVSKRQNGWTGGVGIEHMVHGNLTAKIEYRYTDLGSATISTASIFGASTVEYHDYKEQSVRLGLMYHF